MGNIVAPPGVSPALWAAGLLARAGQIGSIDENAYLPRKKTHYENIELTGDVPVSVSLFNNAVARAIRTIGNNRITNSTVFLLQTVRISVQRGLRLNGTIPASPAVDNTGIYNSTAVSNLALEQLRDIIRIMKGGSFSLTVGQRVLIDEHRGLESFPEGSGLNFDCALAAGGATPANFGLAQVKNGDSYANTGYKMLPYLIGPDDNIRAELTWGSTFALTANSHYVIKVALEGLEILQANR